MSKVGTFFKPAWIILAGYGVGLFSTYIVDPVAVEDWVYSERLRLDAKRLAKRGDYEGAFARLDQARLYAPIAWGNGSVDQTRTELRAKIHALPAPAASVGTKP